jgi:hypothetical protein
MTALAAAGGTAIVQAAGTDAWEGFRQQIARFFGRGDHQRELAELERLDQTAQAFEVVNPDDLERIRNRQEATWQTRFETLLESLDNVQREQAAAQLREILESQTRTVRAASAGREGLAAGGNISISAEDGSIAAGVIHGGASIGSPTQPDPSQG